MHRIISYTIGVLLLHAAGDIALTAGEPIASQRIAGTEPQVPNSMTDEVRQKLREQKIPDRDDIVLSVLKKLPTIKQNDPDGGHIVVGQIKVDDRSQYPEIIAQMPVLDDGYFVEAVEGAAMPLYFWHPELDRLEVIPYGKPGEIQNLGVLRMVHSTRPLAVVKGTLLSGRSDVPKGIKAVINYETPWVNRIGISSDERKNISGEIVKRITATQRETIVINDQTGEFTVSDLPELSCRCSISTEDSESWDLRADFLRGDELDYGHCSMSKRRSPAAKTEPSVPASSTIGRPKVEKLLKELQASPKEHESLLRQITSATEDAEAKRKREGEFAAVVVVGQVLLPVRNVSHSTIAAPAAISPMGYFAQCVETGKPMQFRLHGYDPLDYVPAASNDGFEYCGILRMKKSKASDMAEINGHLSFEDGQLPPDFSLYAIETIERQYRSERDSTRLLTKLKKTGEFEFQKLSPIGYDIRVSAPGFVPQHVSVVLNAKDRLELPTILLRRPRFISISYIESATSDFSKENSKTAQTRGTAQLWLPDQQGSNVRKGIAAHLSFSHTGDLFSASVWPQPGQSLHLGERTLDECRNLSGLNGVLAENHALRLFNLRKGHVYMMHGYNDNQWILFRVEETGPFVP